MRTDKNTAWLSAPASDFPRSLGMTRRVPPGMTVPWAALACAPSPSLLFFLMFFVFLHPRAGEAQSIMFDQAEGGFMRVFDRK